MNTILGNATILVVEDNPGDARLIREYIGADQWEEETEWVDNLNSALEIILEKRIDGILLDLHLPDSKGLSTLTTLIKHTPDIPIVVLTGLDDDELGAEAVREGAQDYLAKNNIDEAVIKRTLGYAVERHRMSRQINDIINNNIDAVMVFNRNGELKYQNSSAQEFTTSCYSPDLFYERIKSEKWINGVSKFTIDSTKGDVCDGCSNATTCNSRTYELRKVITRWNNEDESLIIFMHEITEQLRAREVLEQTNIQLEERVDDRTRELMWANKALRTLGHCNQIIGYSTSEEELLTKVCEQIVTILGFPLVWIGLCEKKTEGLNEAKTKACAGADSSWLKDKTQSLDSLDEDFSIVYECERTHESVIKNNQRDEHFKCEMVLPFEYESVKGILCLYSNEANAFEYDENQLFNKLANDIAFGIANQRTRAEREKLQDQLEQTRKMEALGQLTAGIAHDFNNMLAGIMGYTELSMDLDLQQDAVKLPTYLKNVYSAAERARDLISQMMVFSRTGEDSELKNINISDVMNEAINLLRPMLPSSVDLSFEHDLLEIPEILADSVQMHQVIMNLCVNARDAMEELGKIELAIKVIEDEKSVCTSCHRTSEGRYVQISVQDNGPGISAENLERMFEPFYTTKAVGKGTGMGLSTVHGIIHEHNGHIVVETAIGKGTCFKLLFPIPTLSNDNPTVSTGAITSEPLNKGNDQHILVVDDDETIAEFLKDYLEKNGYKVSSFTDSLSAMNEFFEMPDKYDLVITDQTMPKLTGSEMAKEMLSIRPALPIILCTGYSARVDKESIEKLGIKTFLKKPVALKVLLKHINDAITLH